MGSVLQRGIPRTKADNRMANALLFLLLLVLAVSVGLGVSTLKG